MCVKPRQPEFAKGSNSRAERLIRWIPRRTALIGDRLELRNAQQEELIATWRVDDVAKELKEMIRK